MIRRVPFVKVRQNEQAFWPAYLYARKFHQHRDSLDTGNEVATAWAADWRRWNCYVDVQESLPVGGFVIVNCELRSLWHMHRGQGARLIRYAIQHGATWLKCFDGPLVPLYSQHGFKVETREANWEPGGPDVVTMRIKQ